MWPNIINVSILPVCLHDGLKLFQAIVCVGYNSSMLQLKINIPKCFIYSIVKDSKGIKKLSIPNNYDG